MASTSKNPSSPPKGTSPTPSDTPSTTPISKKGRVKMMARKDVVGGEKTKKINEKLKASREEEPQKSDESFKSATKGEETVSSKSEQVCSSWIYAGVETTESGKGEETDGEKQSVRETGGSGSGEVAERSEIPGTARANKKRKDVSSIPVETPPTRGRPTRSQKKQNEAELKKALEESKRKADAKGKKKVVEPIEAVEIDEMDLVLRDEVETEDVEVMTPKAKKVKTSSKKSVSKTKSVEPSTLAKRTRSALKSRKVKIVEEEEWSGEVEEEEEEYDIEKDKMLSLGREPS
ncbi:PREDICTED: uncharacterized protein LOC109231659 [Nicotiana attenuata]|uniref:uncharacterized protein LOC109231659 n=1 Tax=Nicotiana attenuata TaxID=49451 RepID=UPI00090569CB|nr:PREDICTED: uncharacterized protein LOC109231659 [Nicotiana attenuata]